MKNNLPKYWCVKNDGSDTFKNAVIKYLNETNNAGYVGSIIGDYYGYDGKPTLKSFYGSFENKPAILTLEQFIEMSKPIEEWSPKRGELVYVSDHEVCSHWDKRIFLAEVKGIKSPIIVVPECEEQFYRDGFTVNGQHWKYMRKIETPTHIELTLEEIATKFCISVDQLKIVK